MTPSGPFRNALKARATNRARTARTPATRAPRRSQQDRSAEAKTQLMRAAVDVLMERGYNGLTTKEVASRAGFSNGALMHHYRTKADLVVAATNFAFEQAVEPSRRIAATIDRAANPIKAFIEDSWQVYFDWTFTIAIEVLVVARTDPALMARIEPVMRHTREMMIDIWTSVFSRQGLSDEDSKALVALTLLIVRGMAMDDVWIRDRARMKTMLSLWAKIAIAHIEQSPPPPKKSSQEPAADTIKPRAKRGSPATSKKSGKSRAR